MPIRPENRARYPKDWKAISLTIRKRARWRCECRGECGQDHKMGRRHSGRCEARHAERHPDTGSTVVLTVAHLDHRPENCAPANLRAMCQRCHNRLDTPMRTAGKKARRRAAWALRDLLDNPQAQRVTS